MMFEKIPLMLVSDLSIQTKLPNNFSLLREKKCLKTCFMKRCRTCPRRLLKNRKFSLKKGTHLSGWSIELGPFSSLIWPIQKNALLRKIPSYSSFGTLGGDPAASLDKVKMTSSCGQGVSNVVSVANGKAVFTATFPKLLLTPTHNNKPKSHKVDSTCFISKQR